MARHHAHAKQGTTQNAPAMKTFADHEWPCRKWPWSQQCDRRGKKDFMGHTCVRSEISRLQSEIIGAERELKRQREIKEHAESVISTMNDRINRLSAELENLS